MDRPIKMGVPPFSSPDPKTEKGRMVPIVNKSEDFIHDGDEEKLGGNYDSMTVAELSDLAENRGVQVEGRKKADYINALKAADNESEDGEDEDNDDDDGSSDDDDDQN